jgi:DNA-binding response OmpR family regulator
LIVDDDPDFHDFLSVLLELEGYEVRSAYDGASALAELAEGGIDLVLLDVLMPGMDGFEVLTAMGLEGGEGGASPKGGERPPVIFVSALADDKHVRRGLSLGGIHYITKPLDVAELLGTVKEILAESGRS